MDGSKIALLILVLFIAGAFGGLFLYEWKHRKDPMPKVAPLPPDDDDRDRDLI